MGTRDDFRFDASEHIKTFDEVLDDVFGSKGFYESDRGIEYLEREIVILEAKLEVYEQLFDIILGKLNVR